MKGSQNVYVSFIVDPVSHKYYVVANGERVTGIEGEDFIETAEKFTEWLKQPVNY